MHHTPSKRKKITDFSGQNLKKIDNNDDIIDSTSLILDNNKITEFSTLTAWTSLEKLSVAENGLARMNQFEALWNLKVLDLKNNRIETIEGLSSLPHLEWLCLSGNNIKVIKNLKNNISLHYLDLSDNCIEEVGDLSFLIHLKVLLFHTNKIGSLRNVAKCFPPSIHTLTMAENELYDLTEVQLLANLPFLKDLTLFGNPFACSHNGQYVDYRPYVISCCKKLQTLDGSSISQADRHIANVYEAEGHLKMLQPGQHSQLASYLLEASPGYSPKISQLPQMSKTKERSQSTEVNTSLLESESMHLPLLCDSPPKNKHSPREGPRPLTAPQPRASHGVSSRNTLMSDYMESSVLEGDDRKANYREEDSILSPLPSKSSPGRSLEFERSLGHFEGHGTPQAAIEITNEIMDNNKKFRAKVHVAEVKRNATSSPKQHTQRRPDQGYMKLNESKRRSPKALPSESAQTSVSLTADEAANLLHLAAALIQAYVRGFLQRRRYQRYLLRHRAAVRIQAAWRGYSTRNRNLNVVNIKNELKMRQLTSKISFLESKINRVKTERKKDKAIIASAMKILVQEISFQREKLAQIEDARKEEESSKNDLERVCQGLQDEICRLRLVIESAGTTRGESGTMDNEAGDVITSSYRQKEEDRGTVGLNQVKMSSDKISSESISGDMTSSSPKSVSSIGGTLEGLGVVTGHIDSRNDQVNLDGHSFIEKGDDIAHFGQRGKASSKETQLVTKGSSVSSITGWRINEPKSCDDKAFSVDCVPRVDNGVSEKGTAIRSSRGGERDHGIGGNKGIVSDGKEMVMERQVVALNETFDLGSRDNVFSDAVEVLDDDLPDKDPLNANRVISEGSGEKSNEGRYGGTKALEGAEVDLIESGDEGNDDLEDKAKVDIKNFPNNLKVAVVDDNENIKIEEDIDMKNSDQLCNIHKFEEDSLDGLSSRIYSVEGNERKRNGPDNKCSQSVGIGNDCDVKIQRNVAGDDQIVLDDIENIIETDAGEKAQKNAFSHEVLEVWQVPRPLASVDEEERSSVVVEPETKEPCHVAKDDCISSDKGSEKDLDSVEIGSNHASINALDLVLESGLHKSSLYTNAKKRRRTLFPKVLPEENDINSPKSKANLSADSQMRRATCFSPLAESSKACAYETETGKEANVMLESKNGSRVSGEKDVVIEGELFGNGDIARREVCYHKKDVRYDSDIRTVYREVSVCHGDIINGREMNTVGVAEERAGLEKPQETRIEQNQGSSADTVMVSKQIEIDPTNEAGQLDAMDYARQVLKHDRITDEQKRSTESRTEITPGLAQTTRKQAQTVADQSQKTTKMLEGELEQDKNTPVEVTVARKLDRYEDIQRNKDGIPGNEYDRGKEVTDCSDSGQVCHTDDRYPVETVRIPREGEVDGKDGGAVDNDTIIAVDDVILQNTRTSTPKKASKGGSTSQLHTESKDTIMAEQIASVKMSLSPRLNDMPDCLQSMPRIVAVKEEKSERSQGLPLFVDHSFDSSADESFAGN